MIEPPVLSLRPTMVLLNNTHYPNPILPTRITDPVCEFFNALDQVVQDMQDKVDEEEEGDDPEAGSVNDQEGSGEEDQPDQDSDSSNTESESLGLDQKNSGDQDVNQQDEIRPQLKQLKNCITLENQLKKLIRVTFLTLT